MTGEQARLSAVDDYAQVQWKSLQEGDEQLPSEEQKYPGGRAPGGWGWPGRKICPASIRSCQYKLYVSSEEEGADTISSQRSGN